jgi:predicted double-glycine peptidase
MKLLAAVISPVAAFFLVFSAPLSAVAASQWAVAPVPFYSQFSDISAPKWQKVGCGITDLAMIIDYYKPGAVTAESLLHEGIAADAYDYSAGWKYQGLIDLSKRYGLTGSYYSVRDLSDSAAFARLTADVQKGPVIVSVHYQFNPKSTIPHLVVIDGIVGDTVYYNDPAAKAGQKTIAADDFLKAWKKRVIVIGPAQQLAAAR